MHPGNFFGCIPACLSRPQWVFAAALCLATGLGCRQEPENRPIPEPERLASFEDREARLDATVWQQEVRAQVHERAMVKLRDGLIHSTNKLARLAEFQFQEILLPALKGAPQPMALGIRRQDFENSTSSTLNCAEWQTALKRLHAMGWTLDQAEWNHERFIPSGPGVPAASDFSFELDGQRLTESTRFIVRGTCRVEWASETNSDSLIQPGRLVVSNLTVWERAGPPGFQKHIVATPEAPEGSGGFASLHPLIVQDLNSDGLEDIVMASANKLFLNKGNARFEPMEFIAEKVFHGVRSAGVIADFNNDGYLDFLTVASEGVWTNQLVLYAGTGSVPFTNEPVICCPGLRLTDPSVMTAGDIDQDGDLDIWLAQYKPPYVGGQMPTPYYEANDGYPSVLLLNDGHGQFVDATDSAGLTAKNRRRTYAASFVDLNNDGHLDLVTVNDFAGLDLYYNNGHGHFTDESGRLYNPHLFGMSHCIADFDHDGILDLLAIGMSLPAVHRLEALGIGRKDLPDRTAKRVEMSSGNRLYVLRSGQWVKPSFADQLAPTGWTWGVSTLDLGNDGNLDIYLANGHFSGESSEDYDSHYWRHDIYVGGSREDKRVLYYFARPFMGINTGKTSWNGYQHNVLFLDVGANQYLNIAHLMDVAHETDCRAVVAADLNNDGRMDLLLTEVQWFGNPVTGRHRLLVHLNQLKTDGHWIGARLLTRKGHASPIGAKVFAKTESGSYVAQVITGNSFQAQHPNTVHFGLGQIRQVNELTVQWPSGERQTLKAPAIDTYHTF